MYNLEARILLHPWNNRLSLWVWNNINDIIIIIIIMKQRNLCLQEENLRLPLLLLHVVIDKRLDLQHPVVDVKQLFLQQNNTLTHVLMSFHLVQFISSISSFPFTPPSK